MHLGKNETVPDREVIGIFDIEKTTGSEITKTFLKTMEDSYKTVNLATDLPEAFVLSDNIYTDRVYLTALSAKALAKRGQSIKIKGRIK